MPDLVTIIQNHVLYTKWATDRLLKAAEPLSAAELTHDFGTADKNVFGTFVHVYRSDRTWLQRLHTASLAVEEDSDWAALPDRWHALQQQWIEWSATLDNDILQSSFRYNDLKGNPWESSFWEVLLHVVNHATHHRGQISGFLRALGHTPPSVDFIAYQRGSGR